MQTFVQSAYYRVIVYILLGAVRTTRTVRRLSWVTAVLACLVSAGMSEISSAASGDLVSPPNIVIILADDLGYGDVNFEIPGQKEFSNPHINTPHLAALASQSLVFRHHYAAAPVCSPSRAGLLTGRTPTRCNIDLYINDLRDNDRRFLAGGETTIAEIAKQAGYQTVVFGKWHLNGADWEVADSWTGWTGSFPKQQGFDFGWVTKENPHFTRQLQVNTQKHPGDIFTVDGEPLCPMKGYTSDLVTDAAIGWLRDRPDKSKPFLMYLPYDAVHIRISSADRFEAMYDTGDVNRDAYYANVSHLDDAIGRLVGMIDSLEIAESTIIFFSSDNGPDVLNKWHGTSMCMGTSFPLYGHKYQLHEGGIRVPGLVRWPGVIRAGISDEPNSTLDLLPTICQLTQQALPEGREIDGTSLLPHLLHNERIKRTKPLYWQFEHPIEYATNGEGYLRKMNGRQRLPRPGANVAIRRGKYVLRGVSEQEYAPPTRFQLFDVTTDPEALHDISGENPRIVEHLREQLLSMHGSVDRDRRATVRFIESRGAQRIFSPSAGDDDRLPAPNR